MRKELQLNIRKYGISLSLLSVMCGKHNEGKKITDLPSIDFELFQASKDMLPEYKLRTEYGDEIEGKPFELSVFENGELVCVVIEKEMYPLEVEENVVLQRGLNNPESKELLN